MSRYQAQVMAEQLAGHQGLPGFQLDREVPAKAGVPPVSYLIAAWITGAHTAASNTVMRWLGPQDWRHAPRIVFPAAALALFSVDMAEHLAADAARTTSASSPAARVAARSPGGPVRVAALVSSPCTTVDSLGSWPASGTPSPGLSKAR